MPKPSLMKYLGIHVETDYLDDNRRRVKHDAPKVFLVVATPSGQARNIELDRNDVGNLLRAASTVAANLLRADS